MGTTGPITVLVVDVCPVVREGVATIFARHSGLAVVAQGACGREALALWRRTRPDVTLLDLALPDTNGIEVIAALRAEDPAARVIVFTTYGGVDDIVKAIRAGARAYILKDASGAQLIEAVKTVQAGGRYLPATLEARLAQYLPGGELTGRELQVLECLCQGQQDREIAAALDIRFATVRTHINRILSKLGVQSRTQAIVTALSRGTVHPQGRLSPPP
jgi:two-component system NarL family response regulator